jgi:enoyl-CoA hydratase/carnithine racemase
MSPVLHVQPQGSVFVLTLTNGQQANTLDDHALDLWHAALDQIADHAGNTALLITSNDPKFWCNGFNLDYIRSKGQPYLLQHLVPRLDQLLERLALLDAPTVACLTGHTYGGGALLAAACDFRLMRADRGWFCLPEIDLKLGLSPTMQRIAELLPNPQAVRELLLTGQPLGGQEAARRHVVDAAYPLEQLESKAMELATQLAGKDRATYTQLKQGLKRHLRG